MDAMNQSTEKSEEELRPRVFSEIQNLHKLKQQDFHTCRDQFGSVKQTAEKHRQFSLDNINSQSGIFVDDEDEESHNIDNCYLNEDTNSQNTQDKTVIQTKNYYETENVPLHSATKRPGFP